MKPPSNPDAIKESGGNQKPSTRRKRATSNYESGIGDLVCFIIALAAWLLVSLPAFILHPRRGT